MERWKSPSLFDFALFSEWAVCFDAISLTSLFHLFYIWLRMVSHGCRNCFDCFCYIRGEFVGAKLGDQNKSWAAHNVYYVCIKDLRMVIKWEKVV